MISTLEIFILIFLIIISISSLFSAYLLYLLLNKVKYPEKTEDKAEIPFVSAQKSVPYLGRDGLYDYDNIELEELQKRIMEIEKG